MDYPLPCVPLPDMIGSQFAKNLSGYPVLVFYFLFTLSISFESLFRISLFSQICIFFKFFTYPFVSCDLHYLLWIFYFEWYFSPFFFFLFLNQPQKKEKTKNKDDLSSNHYMYRSKYETQYIKMKIFFFFFFFKSFSFLNYLIYFCFLLPFSLPFQKKKKRGGGG